MRCMYLIAESDRKKERKREGRKELTLNGNNDKEIVVAIESPFSVNLSINQLH